MLTKLHSRRKASILSFSFIEPREEAKQELTRRSSARESVVGLNSSGSNTVLYTTQSGIERFLQSAENTTAQSNLRKSLKDRNSRAYSQLKATLSQNFQVVSRRPIREDLLWSEA